MSRNVVWVAAVFVLASCARGDVRAPTQNSTARPMALALNGATGGVTMTFGESVQLTPTLSDTLGKLIALPQGLVIVSRDTTVAAVDASLAVHGNRAGFAWLLGSLPVSGKILTDSIQIVVQCAGVAGGNFTPASQTMTVGQTFTAHYAELTACGNPDTFTWSSSGPSIATVDSISGLVTAVSAGHTSINARGNRLGPVGGIPVTVTP
jgi:hypothetical protein